MKEGDKDSAPLREEPLLPGMLSPTLPVLGGDPEAEGPPGLQRCLGKVAKSSQHKAPSYLRLL